ncbi:MAG: PEP-CTERM sorting domain-containing protein [Burkholderiales bacterium PBB5]|nr:MAG: PEP-CTERM sorting domain-containing protein [Burkholderiales bacterium PBB5]
MNKFLIAACACLGAASIPAHAAKVIDATHLSYSETFDALSSTTSTTNLAWANDSTLANWSLFNRASGTAATTYRSDNGGSNTGYFYSFGTTGNTDRALGSIGSSSSTGYWGTVASGNTAGYIALALTNNTGATLTDISLTYDGEQWRDAGNNPAVKQTMRVEYGYGASFGAVTTWTAAGSAFNFDSPTFTTTGAALNGNVAANRVAGLGGAISTSWANGSTLWVRWAEVNDNGSDHALAIDNVSFNATMPVPEPESYALMLAGLAAVGFMARRRAQR